MNRKLSDNLQARAVKEINEVPSRIEEDIEQIRQWLLKQPHLKVKVDDDQILGFLRGCKYSLQKTKQKLDFHFTIRTLVPEFFCNQDPFAPEIQEIINAGCILPLPKPDSKSGARIIMFYLKNANPDTMPFINLMLVVYMVFDILIKEDDDAIVSGVIYWSEIKNLSAKYVTQLSPTVIKKTLNCTEKAYPFRVKAYYITNCPSYLEIVYNIAKSFTKIKITQRMSVLSDITDLYDKLPQNMLPKEFGGENGSLDTIKIEWKKKIESYRDWFLENKDYKSNELFRYGEPKTTENVFGIEGSFRKMQFD
ncbi:hypothetical protein FQA39_LY11807 [Lamprigera yunnana]|nr:hypothetical protein FQA39_LY11807 [Lamprigera yunnana]